MFLDPLRVEGSLEKQSKIFLAKARGNARWAEENFMRFVVFQLEGVKAGEITGCTISNYYKATKLFCEMNNSRTAHGLHVFLKVFNNPSVWC
jgi:hypothetical protein